MDRETECRFDLPITDGTSETVFLRHNIDTLSLQILFCSHCIKKGAFKRRPTDLTVRVETLL